MQTGLSEKEVQTRREAGLINQTVEASSNSTWDIIRRNTFTFFNLVFAGIAILFCLVQAWNQLTFFPIIVANTAIGIYQEMKAKRILDKMTLLHTATATAIRGGEEKKCLTTDLVQDDLVLISAGQQIMADSRIVDGYLSVNEALLTGESDEIEKGPDDHLLSGSFVVTGKAYIRLEKVGKDAYISQLSQEAKTMNVKEQSDILKALNKVLTYVSFAIFPIAIALFSQQFFIKHADIKTCVVSTLSAIIGMIPEGLYLLTTLALTMSSVILTRRQVMLHNMKSIESLAHVDVLCVDKTGTITESEMQLEEIIISKEAPISKEMVTNLLTDYARFSPDTNDTMTAIRNHYGIIQEDKAHQSDSLPFSSKEKLGGMRINGTSYLLGAPEFVLRNDYDDTKEEWGAHLDTGKRVLVFAHYDSPSLALPLSAPAKPLAYLIISNPIRQNAVETFRYFTQQGVSIKVISGDNPRTVAKISQDAQIPGSDNWVDARELTTPELLKDAAMRYSVFGRVTPDQKRQLVQALHHANKTVAMTGDGVNDILAMKEADCSIAMSSGSEAATQAAQVVLLDNDFKRLTEVLHEGRRVVNNVQRSSILFLNKNIFSIIFAILSILFAFRFPVQASQLSLISAFTIGIPGFLFSLEINTKPIHKNFIRQVIFRALPASLTSIFSILLTMVSSQFLHISSDQMTTAATILMAVVSFIIMIEITLPMNAFRIGVIALNMIGMLLTAFILPKLFALSGLSLNLQIVILVLSSISFFIYKGISQITNKWL